MSGDLLNVLLNFQPDAPSIKSNRDYDQAVRAHVAQLNNISPSHWSKGADTPQDVLVILNPAVNSIAYAFALRHRISVVADKRSIPDTLQPGGDLWNKLVLWLETFDPVQMRYAGNEYRKLVDYVEQIARTTGSPGLAIAPIRSAMTTLDLTTGTFTMSHLNFIHLCVETRSYAAALPILDNYIHSLPSKIPSSVREGLEYSAPCADIATSGDYIHEGSGHTKTIKIADLHEYYVLGAMAYLGVRQFKKAKQMLEHVLMAPSSNIANGYMLEAYKKWVLGKHILDMANGNAVKHIKSASKAYKALRDAYKNQGSLMKLKAQVKAGAEIWAEDGNTGLVNEVVNSQLRAYISRLTKTFSAIPVANIASNIGGTAEEAAQYLDTLIKDGYLNASLEKTDKSDVGVVLRFYLDPTKGPLAKTEKQQQQALFEQTLRTNMLAEQVKEADYRLTLTKEYVENLKRQSKRAGGGDAMDTAWDDGMGDEEDLMADMR